MYSKFWCFHRQQRFEVKSARLRVLRFIKKSWVHRKSLMALKCVGVSRNLLENMYLDRLLGYNRYACHVDGPPAVWEFL